LAHTAFQVNNQTSADLRDWDDRRLKLVTLFRPQGHLDKLLRHVWVPSWRQFWRWWR